MVRFACEDLPSYTEGSPTKNWDYSENNIDDITISEEVQQLGDTLLSGEE